MTNAPNTPRHDPIPPTSVAIVGGGPAGLAIAVKLGLRGVECVVIEPRSDISRLQPRAKTLNVRTLQRFRRWGIVDRVRAALTRLVARHLLPDEIPRAGDNPLL
ncbi:FAD-dependent monooxygenase [Amycolatopsis ultiminotia]|uniref:FAD-dependent monooxygenase n=1 Tax=Amycolatopsis ultiminotia TaxID=543629 RepID=UPI003CD058D5